MWNLSRGIRAIPAGKAMNGCALPEAVARTISTAIAPPAFKESIGPRELALAQKDVAAIGFHQGTPAKVANLVGDYGTQVAADGAPGRDPERAKTARCRRRSRKTE